MLKFIKHHMTSIGHIEIYPIISLLIFFLFFTVMLLAVWKSDKKYIHKMQQLPLQDCADNNANEYEESL